MQVHLPIISLDIIDPLSYQKCLLPKAIFSKNAKPGQWAKCYFCALLTKKHYYAVAQIFPREELDEVCFLDTCVSNYHPEKDQQLILEKILVFENNKPIKKIDVLFQLNIEYFIENSSFLSKPHLHKIAKILLQKYHLTHGSIIRDTYLLENGIDSVRIEIENNYPDSSYVVTDNTNVEIKSISLTRNILNPELVYLNVSPFTQARQELDDLMKVMYLQGCVQKCLLGLSLNAIVVGPVGCGKTTLIEECLQNHLCNVFYVQITNILKQYPGETEAELRKIFKAACDFENKFKPKNPTIILLEEIHLLAPQPTSRGGSNSESFANYMRICAQLLSLVDELFTSGTNIMCLATTSKPDNLNELIERPGRFEKEISIAALQEDHRRDILLKLFNQGMPNFNINPAIMEKMAKQTQGYVLADLALLVQKVTQIALTKLEENIEDVIICILKKSKPISLKGIDVNAYKTTETFDSIGGMMKLKNILNISVLAGLKQHKSFQRFGLSLPKGVLLYGPPGCAKTTIAKCLATEANMMFIATSAAEVYSPYVGCAEKFIAKIFQTARKNSPCLIFLDEIDSLVGRRSSAGSSNSSDTQIRILSTLLTEMDGVIVPSDNSCHIIVVAATNRPDMVDDALMRPGRFDKLIHVPAPDLLSRRSILDLYRSKMPFSKCIDLECLAVLTENYSGADICNLCNEAALQAFKRDFNCVEIIMDDFENILKTSKSSLVKSQIDWYYEFENKFL